MEEPDDDDEEMEEPEGYEEGDFDHTLELETDEDGNVTNIYIFKGCGGLPVFFDEPSVELDELRNRLERLRAAPPVAVLPAAPLPPPVEGPAEEPAVVGV